jgi:DNA-binding NarL/FixJ family response regulator
VVAGEAIFGARVAGRVLSYFAERTAETGTSYPFPELTERERVVLALLARGRSTRDIALELFLSPKTVSNNLTAVFAKLQVAGRSEAIVRAHERGVGGLT